MDISGIDANQTIEIGKGLLLILAPVLVEVVNRLSERVLGRKLPLAFITKPILSAIFAAIIGMLTDLGTGVAVAAGLTGSMGYTIAKKKHDIWS